MKWDWLMTDEEAAQWREKYEKWNKKFWRLMRDYVLGLADEENFARLNKEYDDL